jgi:hypothetical protein
MWIMIQRRETGGFAVDAERSSRPPARLTMDRDSAHWLWKTSKSAPARAG